MICQQGLAWYDALTQQYKAFNLTLHTLNTKYGKKLWWQHSINPVLLAMLTDQPINISQ
jgi:hypothetical protein